MSLDPVGLLVRQLFVLQRVANAIAAEGDVRVQRLFERLVRDLIAIDPTEPGADRYRRQRVERFMERVERHTREEFADWVKTVRATLATLGEYQARETARMLLATLGDPKGAVRAGPSVNMVKAIIDRDPFQGATLHQWAEKLAGDTVFRVRRQVQLGMLAEESIDDIVRRVRGRSVGILRDGNGKPVRTKAGGLQHRYAGGMIDTTTREATAIVRTAVNHVANQAALETYRANEDVTTEYEWVATLDSRVSEICLALHGRRFRYDDPKAPMPPAHYNCRSTIVPVINWERLGLEPPDTGTRAARMPTEKDGRIVDGKTVQVRADLSMEEWLRQQPEAVQDRILGAGKAKLFREGKITLRDLIRDDLTIVPLHELVSR